MSLRVLVTGMGIISAIGHDISEYTQSLRAGSSGIGLLEYLSEPVASCDIGAEVRDFSYESMLLKYSWLPESLIQRARHSAQRSPYVIQTSVGSGLEAWGQAQLHNGQIPQDRLGLIVAGHNLANNYQYSLYPRFQQGPEYLTPRYALHFMDTDHVGTLSEIFGIRGEGFTVGGASASGNVGILKGYQLIQLGVVDACVVVGALADPSPMELQGFCNIGAMGGKRFHDEPEKACRPFDSDHEGFIYGQASGCLILESSESATKRDAHPLAEILGGSLVLDGNRLADPSEDGETRAMKCALEQAQVGAEGVDYVNAHGTSSPLGDETEVRAIRAVFERSLSRLWINSTKSLTGHCLYSAGVIEAIATIIQMKEGFVHPNINLDNPIDSECRFSGATSAQAHIDVALSNSFGFGGISTSVVLGKGA